MEPFQYRAASEGPGLFGLDAWTERFPLLAAGFTSRTGGESADPYASLNCGLHVGDSPEEVVANRERTAAALATRLEDWAYAEQVHGSRVARVTAADKGRGTRERDSEFPATDAFVTNEPGVMLALLYADCVPLYFFDPVTRSVGLAHAGWKGTAARIAAETIRAMEREFGASASDIQAAIGPSIGQCCYEVDEGVVARMREALGEAAEKEPERYFEPAEGGKSRLDLQQVNRQIMIKAGILPASIEVTGLCTSCRTDLLFSHRKENGRTGRMQAWIGLKSDRAAIGG
ncbi:peptidoglycan editing factor PgeF [Gorillibacterium sp. sgz500922]|uniref:peptidoglycan editing factor PgeF n=1 Tax=Gorillibacterium sp. sgz500922 TaxID=3446694 RepID=UPI003F67B9B9